MAVLAGPLDGMARARPEGWLPERLTTDNALAEEQAREILGRCHPGFPTPVRCISARYRTAAFALGDPPCQLLKRHADEAAYLGEMLAYELLMGENILPTLHSSSDGSRTLVVDYLDEKIDLTNAGSFEELVEVVAIAHTVSGRWHPAVFEVMSCWRAGLAPSAPVSSWIDRPGDWRRVMHLLMDAHGPDHVPLGNLDLKPDHVRRRTDGCVALIDTETLRPDLTGLPDLITLAFIACGIDRGPSPRWIRHAYLEYVNRLGAAWSDAALVSALQAFAAATGLRSLHGVHE